MAVWQNMGWGTIIFLAAITGINPELYEAATVDGANRMRKMWHVTLPGIRATTVTLLILNLGPHHGLQLTNACASFGNVLVKDYQYQLAIYIYEKGLAGGNFSKATAVGLFQSLLGFILVLACRPFCQEPWRKRADLGGCVMDMTKSKAPARHHRHETARHHRATSLS